VSQSETAISVKRKPTVESIYPSPNITSIKRIQSLLMTMLLIPLPVQSKRHTNRKGKVRRNQFKLELVVTRLNVLDIIIKSAAPPLINRNFFRSIGLFLVK
jgi:hypothetical protein